MSMCFIGEIPRVDEIPKKLAGKIHPKQRFAWRLQPWATAEVIKMDGGRAQAKYTVEASVVSMIDSRPTRMSPKTNMKSNGTN